MALSKTDRFYCDTLLNMMEKRSFASISASDLIKESGKSKSTFYNHFGSIFDVIGALEDDCLELIEQKGLAQHILNPSLPAQESMNQSSDFFANYIKEHARTFSILLGPNGDAAFRSRLYQDIRNISLEFWCGNREQKLKPEERFFLEWIVGGQLSVVVHYANHPNDYTLEEMRRVHNHLNTMLVASGNRRKAS